MATTTTCPDAIRHRLLEGVLLRLARRPEAEVFILRGGMLLRHWFRPVPRPAEDLDLVTLLPFDIAEATRRLLLVLAEEGTADGVVFDTERSRWEGIWLETGAPGVRMFISGRADGAEADFHMDITFGPLPRPAPVLRGVLTDGGVVAEVWSCRPETVVGQKAQALCHLGALGWRPKDLNDLRLLLARVPMEQAALSAALAAYLADLGQSLDHARAIFGPGSWWGMKRCSARWLDFARASRGQEVPRDLRAVVADVAARLGPVLEVRP